MRPDKPPLILIALGASPVPQKNQASGGAAWLRHAQREYEAQETLQILEILKYLGKEGQPFAPILACRRDSELSRLAKAENLPLLELISGANPLDILKIIGWQRQARPAAAIAFDDRALRPGLLLKRLAGASDFTFIQVFLDFFGIPGKRLISGLGKADFGVFGSARAAELFSMPDVKASGEKTRSFRCMPGIDSDRFTPAAAWQQGRFVFGMAQSLVPDSGALMTVRAMAAMWQKEDLPAWEVRMYGQGPRFSEILNEAKNLGVASRLSLLWDQPLPEALRHCHAWLAPGTSVAELPATLWAGIAAGVPTICSDTMFHEERLDFRENLALRIKYNDPQELARAMMTLMTEPDTCARLVHASSLYRPQIGLAAMAERFCGILEDCLGRNARTDSPGL